MTANTNPQNLHTNQHEHSAPEASFYVLETFRRAGGGSITDLAYGPFSSPDQARIKRDRVLEETPSRNVHCAEFRVYG